MMKQRYTFTVNIRETNGKDRWLTSVYGSTKCRDRDGFWNELKILHSLCSPIWMLAGDFNIVRWPSETNAKSLDKKNMSIFNNIIQDFGLVDPLFPTTPTLGPISELIRFILDFGRFLYTKDWESTFKVHH
ncbi:putative ribonuclease H protein [Cucumis melo var. makuwa]|uniref:Ribonuclease H protein n=1 Tax=Cucumis melo var. makuwa TaxID=1194695 RepID=A0A5D3DBM1_CUCMM|nr:putative ribonuclease H protein [Cucumis melo var. makuwa]TYK20982.1 putative ribonuclease H protein [Cucumis melo var. makuwa]